MPLDTNLRLVFVSKLKELYNAENRLLNILPKMCALTSSPELIQVLSDLHETSRCQVNRLKRIFSALEMKPAWKKCKAMQVLINSHWKNINRGRLMASKDGLLIAAAQRFAHYQIASYGTVRNFAVILGENKAAELIGMTCEEEMSINDELNALLHSCAEPEHRLESLVTIY